ncbi:hypothetical protein ACTFIW_011729 [Dictyostelium discoideum]
MLCEELLPIWLDHDCGHDDSFAMLLAFHSKTFNILGISSVHGNQTVDKTTINALVTLEIIGKSNCGYEVVKGVRSPMCRPEQVCSEIHGETGLDCPTAELPKPTQSPITDRPAIQVMFEKISKFYTDNQQKQKVTIVATGSLTNVALLFVVYPQIKPMVEVSLLGGSINFGNISPAAEYNILVDPEAAKVVFESGVKVVMVPLECSHKALVNEKILERISDIEKADGGKQTQFIKIIKGLLLFFADNYKSIFDFDHPPLHDPLAVAYLIDPTIFKCKLMRVDIETSSHLCLGRTVVDLFSMSKLQKNVHVCTDIDVDKFWDLMINAIDNCYNHLYKSNILK